jgi:hypothetical protein
VLHHTAKGIEMEDLAARIGHMEKVVLPEQQAQPCLSVRKRVESMETFFVKRRPRDASGGSRAKLFAMFPDEGPYRREWYPRHMEFLAAGAEFRERLFHGGQPHREDRNRRLRTDLSSHRNLSGLVARQAILETDQRVGLRDNQWHDTRYRTGKVAGAGRRARYRHDSRPGDREGEQQARAAQRRG